MVTLEDVGKITTDLHYLNTKCTKVWSPECGHENKVSQFARIYTLKLSLRESNCDKSKAYLTRTESLSKKIKKYILHRRETAKISIEHLHFVSKIVLTSCEKKLLK